MGDTSENVSESEKTTTEEIKQTKQENTIVFLLAQYHIPVVIIGLVLIICTGSVVYIYWHDRIGPEKIFGTF